YVGAGDRLNVEASTISNNWADMGGGMLIQAASSSAMCNATIVNSTLSDNTAVFSGAIRLMYDHAHLDLINSTIADNRGWESGGLEYSDGASVSLQNTIIAENQNGDGTADSDVAVCGSGSIDTSSSYNLIGRGGNCAITNGTNGNI